MLEVDYISGCDVLGAYSMPAASELAPYFLTEVPTDGEALAQLYASYLRAFDARIASIHTIWHPVLSGATITALHGARSAIVDRWAEGTPEAKYIAVQMLAGILGFFNARYARPDGSIDWPALDQPVNAAVFEGAHDAAKASAAAAKKIGKLVKGAADDASTAVKTAWWTTVALVVGGVGVAVLLAWQLIASGTARAAIERLPSRRYV